MLVFFPLSLFCFFQALFRLCDPSKNFFNAIFIQTPANNPFLNSFFWELREALLSKKLSVQQLNQCVIIISPCTRSTYGPVILLVSSLYSPLLITRAFKGN